MDKYVLEGAFTRFDSFSTENSISFNVSGALDFTEQININMSQEPKEGYTEESLWDVYCLIHTEFNHMRNVLNRNFSQILGFQPTMFKDKKGNTKIYIMCERLFKHSHSHYSSDPKRTLLSLNKAIYQIKQDNLDLI